MTDEMTYLLDLQTSMEKPEVTKMPRSIVTQQMQDNFHAALTNNPEKASLALLMTPGR